MNVELDYSTFLTTPASDPSHARRETPFAIFNLTLSNGGDGPIDILASLATARIMSSKYRVGIGLRSRDVSWEEHETYFWNHPSTANQLPLFTGISTTRNMIYSNDELMRLAPKEHGVLRRIDAVNNTQLLIDRAPIYPLYRVFLVARGYPIGEILRQLGSVPPDLLQTVNEQHLHFQTLAQPVYARWHAVQKALINVSRTAFKVALGDDDPLGTIAHPDAWRFFLLHHMDLIAPIKLPDEETSVDTVAKNFWELFYPNRQLPENFGQDEIYPRAKEYCEKHLAQILDVWKRLKQVIQDAHNYSPEQGYPNSSFPSIEATIQGIPNEAYPVRIHTDRFYRDRWLMLLKEGYLISRPFPRMGPDRRPIEFNELDIPADPRILEPFVMRVHYFFGTLAIDPSLKNNYSGIYEK